MNYLSVCSGIEAATVAWHSLGWKATAFSEIEKFPSKVLAHHYPDVPNLGDMTKFKEWNLGAINLLVGGTPCQSFSVAGLRKGLDDPRGNLMLTYGAIANQFRPDWLVWENVPGVLSSNEGRDFGAFLGMLGELGYGFAYRVLDAQYFGVAQRRRRVFVVGCLGDWRRAAAVLFERDSLSGNPAPSREKKKDASCFTPSSIGGYSEGVGTLRANGGDLGGGSENLIAKCLTTGTAQRYDPETETISPVYSMITANTNANGLGVSREIAPTLDRAQPAAIAQPIGFNARQDPCSWSGRTGALDTDANTQAVAQPIGFAQNQRDEVRLMEVGGALAAEPGTKQQTYLHQAMRVRRLTPVECERLQGFPDNYTNIPGAADGPRYKALGNSMAVPVMRWIGKRIKFIQEST